MEHFKVMHKNYQKKTTYTNLISKIDPSYNHFKFQTTMYFRR